MEILVIAVAALVALTAVDANLVKSRRRSSGTRPVTRRPATRPRLAPRTYCDEPVHAFGPKRTVSQSGVRWWWER